MHRAAFALPWSFVTQILPLHSVAQPGISAQVNTARLPPLLCLFHCIAAEEIALIHQKAKRCFGSRRSVHVSPIYPPPPPPPLANATGVESHDPSPPATVPLLREPPPSAIQPARRRGEGAERRGLLPDCTPGLDIPGSDGMLAPEPGRAEEAEGWKSER